MTEKAKIELLRIFVDDRIGEYFSDNDCNLALEQSELYQIIMAAVLLRKSDTGIIEIGYLVRLINNADEISLKVIELVKKELDRQHKT